MALEEKLAAAGKRPSTVHSFNFPESIPGDIRSVGIKELTAQEELAASKRASGDPFRIAYESAKQALVEINGEKVSLANGSADKAWAEMHPKVRELVVLAHRKIHSASDEETDGFFKSGSVRVE